MKNSKTVQTFVRQDGVAVTVTRFAVADDGRIGYVMSNGYSVPVGSLDQLQVEMAAHGFEGYELEV